MPERPPCPLCSNPSSEAFAKNGFSILECHDCRHRFCVDIESQSQTAATVGHEDNELEAELLRARGKRYGQILQQFSAPGRLLDVGSGSGHMATGLADSGWDVSSVEPNQMMAERASQSGIPTKATSFEDYQNSEQFHAITLIQVIAHFMDPRNAAAQVREMLGDRGLCLIETCDRHSLSALVSGKRWHEYSPPTVVQWFGRKSLRDLMTNSGFEFVTWGRTFKWIGIERARSLVSRKLGGGKLSSMFESSTSWLPRRRSLPCPSEDLFWMLFRTANSTQPE